MTDSLAGKVAIITGAARGTGASHASAFVGAAATVIMTDLRAAEGSELAAMPFFVRHDDTDGLAWSEVLQP